MAVKVRMMVLYADGGVVMGMGDKRLPGVAGYKDVQLNSFCCVDVMLFRTCILL